MVTHDSIVSSFFFLLKPNSPQMYINKHKIVIINQFVANETDWVVTILGNIIIGYEKQNSIKGILIHCL